MEYGFFIPSSTSMINPITYFSFWMLKRIRVLTIRSLNIGEFICSARCFRVICVLVRSVRLGWFGSTKTLGTGFYIFASSLDTSESLELEPELSESELDESLDSLSLYLAPRSRLLFPPSFTDFIFCRNSSLFLRFSLFYRLSSIIFIFCI